MLHNNYNTSQAYDVAYQAAGLLDY